MSLKAKLEAVIYAAEEPVTLAQLAALFTADALAWKAEQAAASAAAAEETAPAERLLPIEEELASLSLEQQPALDAAEASESAPSPLQDATAPDTEDPPRTLSDAVADAEGADPDSAPEQGASEDTAAATPEADAAPEETAAAPDSDGELRRQARQRDREVRVILSQLLDELIASCAADDRGVEIREIAGGYRVATKPECHDAVRMFVRSLKPALKLSLPALETLAVIAYKQPVTAPEVNEIRGVESNATLGSLLSRKLIATAGRKQVIGRPILYKTTREFLLRFGLKDLAELPSMEEFEKMAAIELDEAAGDGIPAESGFEEDPETASELSLDFSEEAPEYLVGQGFSPGIDSAEPPGASAPEVGLSGNSSPYGSLPGARETAAESRQAMAPPDRHEQIATEAAQPAPSPTEYAETEAFPQ